VIPPNGRDIPALERFDHLSGLVVVAGHITSDDQLLDTDGDHVFKSGIQGVMVRVDVR
jgi:hypothetical protein